MLNHSGFNDWAPTYDADVAWAEQNNLYPFAGYTRLLQMVTARTLAHPGNSVLDLGCGTAQLTWRLYEMGKHITAVDFSAEMLRQAKEKMPQSCLIQHDFVLGLPPTWQRKNSIRSSPLTPFIMFRTRKSPPSCGNSSAACNPMGRYLSAM